MRRAAQTSRENAARKAARWLVLAIGLLLATGADAAQQAVPITPDTVHIGILAYRREEVVRSAFEETRQYLANNIPEHRFVLVPLGLAQVDEALRKHQIDFIIINPGNYMNLAERFGVTRLATLQAPSTRAIANAIVGSAVIARADNRKLHTLSDLKGHSLGVVSRQAFGGFVIIWKELDDLGIDPARDLKGVVEVGSPQSKILDAIRSGKVDAGVVRSCLLEEMIADKRIGPDEFKVVGQRTDVNLPCALSSRIYPNWAFAKLAATTAPLAKKVTLALLSMPETGPQSWIVPQDYSSVSAVFRQLHIRPYINSPYEMVYAKLRAYRIPLLLIGVALASWLIHVARVEFLVRQRTRQLVQEIDRREQAEIAAEAHRAERDFLSRLSITGEMAGNIAHEINQPLAAIMNYANGVGRFLTARSIDDPLITDGIRNIVKQTQRVSDTVARIRAFVRKAENETTTMKLNEAVADAVQLFRSFSGQRRKAKLVYMPPRAPILIAGDNVSLQQVVLNLLQNAVDSISEGKMDDGSIIVSVTEDGERATVRVSDNGGGMNEETEKKLFDAFFTTKPQGLGLGLSICRTIIERHSGVLTAERNPVRGVTMSFMLPLIRGANRI